MRTIFVLLIPLSILVILGVLFLSPVTPVNAQCAVPSSCKNCHEVQGQKPFDPASPWHQQHAVSDLCVACHSGLRAASDAKSAHSGIIKDLSSMQTACESCHAADLSQRFDQYASVLGVTGGGSSSGSLTPSNTDPLSGSNPLQPQGPSLTELTGTVYPLDKTANNILTVLFILAVLGCGSYVMWNESRRRRADPSTENWLAWILRFIRSEKWSPYLAGILLGITGILAVLLGSQTLVASGPTATLTSMLVNLVSPAAAQGNMYFKYVIPPSINWAVILLIGVFFGGMLGALSSGTWKLRWSDDPTWVKIFGPQRWKRLVIGFVGAVIIQYGASIAGGCTSGLAISGGMLLAPSAFIFMAGMFTSGIIVALLVYRRKY